MALAADSRLGPLTPGGSIQGPQLSVTQEVLEVAEVPVITIRVTPPPLTGHHPPGENKCCPSPSCDLVSHYSYVKMEQCHPFVGTVA